MHLVGILLLLAYLMDSNFASDFSDSDYYEYDEQMHEEESVSLTKTKYCTCIFTHHLLHVPNVRSLVLLLFLLLVLLLSFCTIHVI